MGAVMPKSVNFSALLRGVPEDEVIETVYLVIRLFRYRAWIRAAKTDSVEAMLHVVTKDREEDQPDKAAQTAVAIAQAIEKAENTKFEEIKDKAADAYVKSLARLIFRPSSTEAKPDHARAKTLLANLRRNSARLIGNGLVKR